MWSVQSLPANQRRTDHLLLFCFSMKMRMSDVLFAFFMCFGVVPIGGGGGGFLLNESSKPPTLSFTLHWHSTSLSAERELSKIFPPPTFSVPKLFRNIPLQKKQGANKNKKAKKKLSSCSTLAPTHFRPHTKANLIPLKKMGVVQLLTLLCCRASTVATSGLFWVRLQELTPPRSRLFLFG